MTAAGRPMGRQGRHRRGGFTLIELMVVLAIVGLLLALVQPTYTGQRLKARRADCMATLLGFAQAMERHYAVHFTYAGAADRALVRKQARRWRARVIALRGGAASYALSIASADAGAYELRATPVATGPQADDGILAIDSAGRRGWDQNGDGDTLDAGEDDWEP